MKLNETVGYVLLGMGIGILVGFAIGDTQPEVAALPVRSAPPMPEAPVIERPQNTTCVYTNVTGRNLPYTVVLHKGETCLTIVGGEQCLSN